MKVKFIVFTWARELLVIDWTIFFYYFLWLFSSKWSLVKNDSNLDDPEAFSNINDTIDFMDNSKHNIVCWNCEDKNCGGKVIW